MDTNWSKKLTRPLHICIEQDNLDFAIVLLVYNNFLRLDVLSNDESPLYIAIKNKNKSIYDYLLRHNADPTKGKSIQDVVNTSGDTELSRKLAAVQNLLNQEKMPTTLFQKNDELHRLSTQRAALAKNELNVAVSSSAQSTSSQMKSGAKKTSTSNTISSVPVSQAAIEASERAAAELLAEMSLEEKNKKKNNKSKSKKK